MKNTIIGIDYSMNSPGVCIFAKGSVILHGFHNDWKGKREYQFDGNDIDFFVSIDTNIYEYKTETERFDLLATKVVSKILKFEYPLVYLEDYSMGSKGMIFNMAENTAALKIKLYNKGIQVVTVAPTTIKKFATGKGTAKKEQMHEAFVTKTGVNLHEVLSGPRKKKLGNPVTDLIDAYWIAEYARKAQA